VATAAEHLQLDSSALGKALDQSIGNVGIVLGMEHHDLGRRDFVGAVRWIVERAAAQLVPVFVCQTIAVAKGFTNVSGVTRV
jgi:hypothetical protein